MSKSLFVIFVSCFLVFAFAWNAHSRPGEKGIFEAPMVEVDGDCEPDLDGECTGSEGKVERFGNWKVEINGAATDQDLYDICFEHGVSDATLLAENVVVDEDGELKATQADGVQVPEALYENPRLVVREDDDVPCEGDVYFTSGLFVED